MGSRKERSFIFHKGFLYHTKRSINNIRYLVCRKHRQLGCKATAKITSVGDQANISLINGHHNHLPENNQAQALEFRKQLKEACLTEGNRHVKRIYEQIALKYAVGSSIVPYRTIRSSMLRWKHSTAKNTQTIKVPKKLLLSIAEIMQSDCWPNYKNCSDGIFFSGNVSVDGHQAIIFGNPEFIRKFIDSQTTYINYTFKTLPMTPKFQPILTIFATYRGHAFPIIHVLMEARTKALYDAVFNYLLKNFPHFINKDIVTDYEMALVESLRTVYPWASIHGSFIHYCQAVLRKAKALGILKQIERRTNGKLLLGKYYCLSLLPARMIASALDSLQNEEFIDLKDYIRSEWLGQLTPQYFSVFKQMTRANKVMVSYNKILNYKLAKHPGFWDFMETIIEIQNNASTDLAQLGKDHTVTCIAEDISNLIDPRLDKIWDKLSDGHLTFTNFLGSVVYYISDIDQQLREWITNLPEDMEEPVLTLIPPMPVILPTREPPPLHYLQYAPKKTERPFLNEPPPLIYFR